MLCGCTFRFDSSVGIVERTLQSTGKTDCEWNGNARQLFSMLKEMCLPLSFGLFYSRIGLSDIVHHVLSDEDIAIEVLSQVLRPPKSDLIRIRM